jgi:hypothetical protein
MWDYPTKSFQTKAGKNWLVKLSLPEIDRFEIDLLLEEWTSIEDQIKQVDAKIVERAIRSEPGKVLNATQALMTAPDSSDAGAGSTKRCFAHAIGKSKKRLRPNPRKNRNQSAKQGTFINAKPQLRLRPLEEHADPRKIQE